MTQTIICRMKRSSPDSTSALDVDVTELPAMSAALVPGAHSPVDLTPLLSPAPKTSQDLLCNILHQMTPPTTAGEHEGTAEGGIVQFFVLGATLDPKIKVKIQEGAYVDLASLCAPSDSSVSVAMGSDGQPSISLTPSRVRPPTSIFEWIRLFGVYASVYVECHPSESSALFTLMYNNLLVYSNICSQPLPRSGHQPYRSPPLVAVYRVSKIKNILSVLSHLSTSLSTAIRSNQIKSFLF